jgi:hypothetical protein
LSESSVKGLTVGIVIFISPDFIRSIIKVITPKFLHHFLFVNSEFLRIRVGEKVQSETPTVLSRTEGDISFSWIQLDISHVWVGVILADNISLLDDSLERLVHVLRLHTKLHNGSVDLVDHEDRLDAFLHSLSEDSLSLNANSFNTIYNDKSTISDSKGSSDFRREINVSWGIN